MATIVPLDAMRAKYGVEPLPDVPLEFPPWLEDLRSSWKPAGPNAEPG